MKFGERVVKYRHLILIVAIILLIPSLLGYLGTRTNYDMLSYLPKDMETIEAHCEDVFDDYEPYTESEGNTYRCGFGLDV